MNHGEEATHATADECAGAQASAAMVNAWVKKRGKAAKAVEFISVWKAVKAVEFISVWKAAKAVEFMRLQPAHLY